MDEWVYPITLGPMIKGFHKEGRTFLFFASLISLALIYSARSLLGTGFFFWFIVLVILVFLYLFFQFFRVPLRTQNLDESTILCPCDGKVVVIEEVEETEYLNARCRQISIFMSPLNVHINWYPVKGIVRYFKYHPGKFLVAWHPKSSTENERTTVILEQEKGKILVRQIAGAVARRIRCYAIPGTKVEQGAELGFIKFGSRVDVFIPLEAKVEVKIDDVVKGGVSSLARW